MTKEILTPLGAAVVAGGVMYLSLVSSIEKKVEKRVTQEVNTAVKIESLQKDTEKHHTDLWKLEGRVDALESRVSSIHNDNN